MLNKMRSLPLKVAVGASSVLVFMSVSGSASAAPVCNGADFTKNGVFDTDGYLACLSGELAATGSDTMKLVAVAGGLTIVGLGAVVAAKRQPGDLVTAA
jgi:LPXTG-motif cell wall-anchored protein